MKRAIIGLLVAVGFFALACGFLDSEMATITYDRAIPVEFRVNADELCPEDQDCEEDTVPAHQDIELLDIEIPVPLDIVDALGHDEVTDVAQQLRSIEITSIDYVVTDNTLTFDLPDVRVYVAPLGTNSSDDPGAVHLTTMPSVPAETDDSGSAPAIESNLEPASDLFKQLQFNAIAGAQPIVKEGQPFPPSGDTDVELTFNVRVTANPLDQL